MRTRKYIIYFEDIWQVVEGIFSNNILSFFIGGNHHSMVHTIVVVNRQTHSNITDANDYSDGSIVNIIADLNVKRLRGVFPK